MSDAGPGRRRVRDRLLVRAGPVLPALPTFTLQLGDLPRTYALAPATNPAALILALHGAGGTGLGTAALSGLHLRGPAAGFTVAFPDGVNHAWNDVRQPELRRREGIDDVAFLSALAQRLTVEAGIDASAVFFVGISNGAFMSEYVARARLIPVAGIGLVAGAATVSARLATPVPVHPATMLMFSGTADPLVPYAGGPIGVLGREASRKGAPIEPRRGVAVAAEEVAADWARANGIPDGPSIEHLAGSDLPVTRLRWDAPGSLPVVLHRIAGGGHTWPGGTQYLPARIVGPVAGELDATGLMLEAFGASR